MKPIKTFTLAVVAIFLILSACTPTQQVTVLEGDEREQVLAYSEDQADNLFAAMNAGDYASFSRDMDDAMVKAINEQAFQQMVATLTPKIGAYQSREVDRVEKIGANTAVVYKAKYEKEDGVTVRLVFNNAEPPQVTGLWFDSPILREK